MNLKTRKIKWVNKRLLKNIRQKRVLEKAFQAEPNWTAAMLKTLAL
jgi:hypothetical protein